MLQLGCSCRQLLPPVGAHLCSAGSVAIWTEEFMPSLDALHLWDNLTTCVKECLIVCRINWAQFLGKSGMNSTFCFCFTFGEQKKKEKRSDRPCILSARATTSGCRVKKKMDGNLRVHNHGGRTHYTIVFKIQWKPFWLATQLYPQHDWTGWQFHVYYDVCAQAASWWMSISAIN